MSITKKGAPAPFFFQLCSPRHRDDAMMNQAIEALQGGLYADALLAAEYACRRHPTNSVPAILRARILQLCSPGLAPKAWYRAWCCDPLNPQLQDAMLQAWLTSGAAASVADLGPAFLPARCRAGTHAPLVNMLRQAGKIVIGACWKNGNAIEAMIFAPAGEAGKVPRARLLLSDETTQYQYEVPADGTRFSLTPPHQSGVWSLALGAPEGRVPQLLHGSPLVWAGTVPAGDRPLLFSNPSVVPANAGTHTEHPTAKRRAAANDSAETEAARPVSIVIPVYRDYALVQSCLESVLHTLPQNKTSATLVVIDDSSPEPALSAWLVTLAEQGKITLLRNPRNLGFIETVNRGMRQNPGHDVLLLNADTQVHGDWIDRLSAALYSAPDIASVSPWTNNGEISSFPRIGEPAPAPGTRQLAEVDTIAAMLHKSGASANVELPSCCGFTLLLRRTAIDQVGLLDGAQLVRGYSEEVDWSMRARELGMRHLCATGVFVAHVGTVSFRFEKTLRVRQNRAVIAARYPDFYPEYDRAVKDDVLAEPREALVASLQLHGNDWLNAAMMALDGVAEFSRPLPARLPQQVTRIAVWGHRRGTPAAQKVLALARLISSEPAGASPLRLLVIGDASEALWHTGVADVLPFAPTTHENTLLSDTAMVGLSGCAALLSESRTAIPLGIEHTLVDVAFEPAAWLASFKAARAQVKAKKPKQTKQRLAA
ncbi:MAG TPA: glycosyltransferase [Telluria sp.]|nr:glycosyltransferase [Telluria sp.]